MYFAARSGQGFTSRSLTTLLFVSLSQSLVLFCTNAPHSINFKASHPFNFYSVSISALNPAARVESMAPRRSTRNLALTQTMNKDHTKSHPKRGLHGFHKLKNGLLDPTPVSDIEKTL
jgi:hypothetical protein